MTPFWLNLNGSNQLKKNYEILKPIIYDLLESKDSVVKFTVEKTEAGFRQEIKMFLQLYYLNREEINKNIDYQSDLELLVDKTKKFMINEAEMYTSKQNIDRKPIVNAIKDHFAQNKLSKFQNFELHLYKCLNGIYIHDMVV